MNTSTREHDDTSTNRLLSEQCVHLERDELKHLHTVELSTELEAVQDDYRYVTGPDRMKLCAFCTGRMLAVLLELGSKGG